MDSITIGLTCIKLGHIQFNDRLKDQHCSFIFYYSLEDFEDGLKKWECLLF